MVSHPRSIPYAELHAHTNFSFLDGASAPDDLVARAVELGLTGLAATDHDGLYGAVRFSGAAEEAGLHPVIGVEIGLVLDAGYPPTVNDPACAETVRRVAERVVGPTRVSAEGVPIAGAEDFAYFAQAVPGAYFFVGAGDDGGSAPGCHHPDFDFDDSILPTAIEMFVGIVDDRLG